MSANHCSINLPTNVQQEVTTTRFNIYIFVTQNVQDASYDFQLDISQMFSSTFVAKFPTVHRLPHWPASKRVAKGGWVRFKSAKLVNPLHSSVEAKHYAP